MKKILFYGLTMDLPWTYYGLSLNELLEKQTTEHHSECHFFVVNRIYRELKWIFLFLELN